MLIETETTANPNVLNFFPPVKIIRSGAMELKDAKAGRKSPLAENIFDLGGVEQILITPDLISVTKTNDAGWEDLKPQIMAEIMDYIATNASIPNHEPDNAEEIVKKIKGLIEARIRRIIQKDGGDISFKGFENGVVYVELSGNCSNCPYAQITLKEGIEKILKNYIPEVKSVESYQV